MVTDSLYAPYIDEKYKEFSKALSPTDILPRAGIRIPVLRALAKTVEPSAIDSIKWHEDVMLKGLAIGNQPWSMEEKLRALDDLLPYLSSWDHTDLVRTAFTPKKKEEELTFQYFAALTKDERIYPKRLGIVWMLGNRKKYDTKTVLDLVIQADDPKEYYISMAIAWTVAEFYLADPSVKLRFPELSKETRRKTIRKIKESLRYHDTDEF